MLGLALGQDCPVDGVLTCETPPTTIKLVATDTSDFDDYDCIYPMNGSTSGADQIWELQWGDAVSLQVGQTGDFARMVLLEGGCSEQECREDRADKGMIVDIIDDRRRFIVFEEIEGYPEPELLVNVSCFDANEPEEESQGCSGGASLLVFLPLVMLRPRRRSGG